MLREAPAYEAVAATFERKAGRVFLVVDCFAS